MSDAEEALSQRIRELRRRHFGPQGKEAFARRLGLSGEEYARFERGVVPPGDVLVRICEATGEDLQWLLTGVASRGTVVISGARRRHQDLIARLARLLDERPELAAPIEAFVDLLIKGPAASAAPARALAPPAPAHLIPVLEVPELPRSLPDEVSGLTAGLALARPLELPADADVQEVEVTEPAASYDHGDVRVARLVSWRDDRGQAHAGLDSVELSACFPGAFIVPLADDDMQPMIKAHDSVIVALGVAPKIGGPALCRLADGGVRCRIWLGERDGIVALGRLCDGDLEALPRARLSWSLQVLYRLTRAA